MTTKHDFRKNKDNDRAQFLHMNTKKEIAFFGVWMSRDTIYFAPRDAQLEIINKWKEWARSELGKHTFGPPKELNTWYF